MRRIGAFLRFWLLSSVLLVGPVALVGALAGGLLGAACGAGLGLLLVTGLSLGLEALLGRVHGAGEEVPPGLQHSLRRATVEVRGVRGQVPRLRIFSDPSPNALVTRSWLGKGTIFLSQGLVSLLTEAELRGVLRQSLVGLADPGLVTRSFGAVLAAGLLARAPGAWVGTFLSGRPVTESKTPGLFPGAMMKFVALYGLARVAIRWSGSAVQARSEDRDWLDAAYKIRRELSVWPLGGNPGAVGLYLCDAWPGRSLISLS